MIVKVPRRRLWSTWVAPCSTVAVFLLTIPAALEPTGAGLDESWLIGLALAARAKSQWGTEVLFTYGPLGYLDFTRFIYFDTWLTSLVANLVLHLVFTGALTLLLIARRARPAWWLLLAALFLLPLPAFPSVENECVVATFSLLVIGTTSASERLRTLAATAAGVLVGFLAMVKGTSLLSGTALLVVFAVFALRPGFRRPAMAAAIAAGAAFVVLWLVAGQTPASLPAYLRGELEIIAGFAPAMGLDGNIIYPARNLQAQLGAIGAAFVLLLGQLAYAVTRRHWSHARLLLLALPVLFVSFKEGFVRFGANQTTFYAMVVVIQALVLVVLAGGWNHVQDGGGTQRTPRILPLALPTLAIMAAGAATLSVPGLTAMATIVPAEPTLASVGERLASYAEAARVLVSPKERQREIARTKAGMRVVFNLNALQAAEVGSHSSDVYPLDVGMAYAYSMRYKPRPILQSYAAYTPYLDHLDATAWSRLDGPERLVVSYQTVDNRYAPFDEPATFRALLENYSVVDARGSQLLLGRHPPQSFIETRLARESSAIGELNTVPFAGDGTVYAYIDMHLGTLGRLLSLAYKPPPAALTLDYGNAQHSFYHFVPAVAADGLLVSSYLGGTKDLGDLIDGRPVQAVTSFTITVDRSARAYFPSLTIEYRSRRPSA